MSLVLFGTVSQCCYATSFLDGIIYIALCALVGRRPSARAALRCTLYTHLRFSWDIWNLKKNLSWYSIRFCALSDGLENWHLHFVHEREVNFLSFGSEIKPQNCESLRKKTLHTYSWAWAWHDKSSNDPHSSDIPYQHTLLLVPLNRAWHWVPPLIAMHSLRRATQPRPHNGKKWAQLAFDMRCRSLGKLGGQRGKTTTKGFWCESSSKWYCELLLCYPIIGYVKE